ncbi:MAG TPA: hypothetical protein VN999_15765, partial [Thermoanaerobaculia bacterium]|nr:hypothetical protein [Thermoanaerobaculia bacterium]
LKTIFKGIAGAGSGADVASETVLEVVYQCLSLPRATVTIEKQANAADTTPAKDCPTAKTWDVMLDRRATSASKDSTVTLLTGPVEHAFISASVPVKHLSELKYDSTNKTIVESQQPSSFFVGINYAWGDVLTAHPWSEAYKGLFASVMLDASKTPWQRFGVAGGWRLMKLGDSLDLSALTVFVGRVWNKGDRLTRPDGSKIGARYPGQLQYGVGFNANKIVDWFKKSS